MKKKKLLAVIMSCFVIAMLCVGCGGQEEETDVSVNDVAESTEPEVSSTDDDSIVETVNGYKRFKVTKDEFISRYNEALEMIADGHGDVSSVYIDAMPCQTIKPESTYSNADKAYAYDFTSYNYSSTPNHNVVVIVDDSDYILGVQAISLIEAPQEAWDFITSTQALCIYSGITGKPGSQATRAEMTENRSDGQMLFDKGDYEYGFEMNDTYNAFIMGVKN